MRALCVYPLLWIAWIAAFLAIELSALWSGHSNFTLSSTAGAWSRSIASWTFLRFFICAFCVWLLLHLVFRLVR